MLGSSPCRPDQWAETVLFVDFRETSAYVPVSAAALVRNWTNVSKRISIPCIIPCIWGLTERALCLNKDARSQRTTPLCRATRAPIIQKVLLASMRQKEIGVSRKTRKLNRHFSHDNSIFLARVVIVETP